MEVDGDTAIVAGYRLPCNGVMRVFVFVRDTNSDWSQEAVLHDDYDDWASGASHYYSE